MIILFHTHALEFIPFQKLRLDNGKAKKAKFPHKSIIMGFGKEKN